MCTFGTWCGALWWPFLWEAYRVPQTSNDSTFLSFLRGPPRKRSFRESQRERQKQLIMTMKLVDQKEKMLIIQQGPKRDIMVVTNIPRISCTPPSQPLIAKLNSKHIP